MTPRPLRTAAGLLAALVLLAGCTGSETETPEGGAAPEPPPTSTETSSSPGPSPSASPTKPDPPPPDPVSVLGLAAQTHRGDGLRLGPVREETAGFTSYDVTYRVRSTGRGTRGGTTLRLSGVLNVPRGRGPFPAVVLAHGYIDPAFYVSGQGMTRERGFLAERGYVALHVDYRGHAGSSPDPARGTDVRLGYAVDVIGAVGALRRADLPVDDDRIAIFGRSMGGGVVQKVATIAPGLVDAVVSWASVSSLEAENFNHFIRGDADQSRVDVIRRARGLPEDAPAFWRAASPRPFFDRITEPVLAVHGRFDDTCPPAWARTTQRAMRAAGVDAQLVWYDDGHAFGPAFIAAMNRTVLFLDART